MLLKTIQHTLKRTKATSIHNIWLKTEETGWWWFINYRTLNSDNKLQCLTVLLRSGRVVWFLLYNFEFCFGAGLAWNIHRPSLGFSLMLNESSMIVHEKTRIMRLITVIKYIFVCVFLAGWSVCRASTSCFCCEKYEPSWNTP